MKYEKALLTNTRLAWGTAQGQNELCLVYSLLEDEVRVVDDEEIEMLEMLGDTVVLIPKPKNARIIFARAERLKKYIEDYLKQ